MMCALKTATNGPGDAPPLALVPESMADWIAGQIDPDAGARAGRQTLGQWADQLQSGPVRRPSKGAATGVKGPAAGWAHFKVERRGAVSVVTLLDANLVKESAIREMTDDLLDLIDAGHHRLVVDFRQVERMASAVVGTLVRACRRCVEAGGGLLKVCGLRDSVAPVFAITGLGREIPQAADVAAAVQGPWPGADGLLALPVGLLETLRRETAAPARPEEPHAEAEAQPVTWRLTIRRDGQEREVELTRPWLLVGRGSDCDVRLDAPEVSRHHAAIEAREGRCFVRDLGSTNGTAHRGRVLKGEETELREGERVRVGRTVLILREGPGGAAPAGSIEELVTDWLGPAESAEGAEQVGAATDEATQIDGPGEGPGLVRREELSGVVVLTPRMSHIEEPAMLEALRNALADASQGAGPGPRRLVLNLENVSRLSAEAIGLVLAHHLKLGTQGGGVRLCQAPARLMALLEQVRMPMLVDCFAKLEDAVLTAWTTPAGAEL